MAASKVFRTRDRDGRLIMDGDTVTSFRGTVGIYGGITRLAQPGKSAKVLVNGAEYYAEVWGLTIHEED